MGRLNRLSLSLSAALLVLTVCGAARSDEDHDRARTHREAGDILPLEEIVRRAEEKRPGQLLETDLEEKKGRLIYDIEILASDGVVWELKYDARSGELLAVEGDD